MSVRMLPQAILPITSGMWGLVGFGGLVPGVCASAAGNLADAVVTLVVPSLSVKVVVSKG